MNWSRLFRPGLVLLVVGVFLWRGFQEASLPPLKSAEIRARVVPSGPGDLRSSFPERFPSQVAILWTQPGPGALGWVHALRQMGIPFFVTDNLDQALRHPLVMIGPYVDAKTFSLPQAEQIQAHAAAGGTVFIQLPLWGALRPLCGYRQYESLRTRHWVASVAPADPVLRYWNRPEESRQRLGGEGYKEVFGTTGFVMEDPRAMPLAEFEDNSIALARRPEGQGMVYFCGLDLNHLILRNQTNHDPEAERGFLNRFEPGTDAWLLFLRAWYETHQRDAVRLATMPDGRRSVLLLSHNVAWESALKNCALWAQREKQLGVGGTFFVQTAYLNDSIKRRFFEGDNVGLLRQLKVEGAPVQSLSVSDCGQFDRFPAGTGSERFPGYRPRVAQDGSCPAGTVSGEVRVSKSLLDGELGGDPVTFFRAGHFKMPAALPEALEQGGYEFDSSFSAGSVLGYFPYALPVRLEFERDSSIYEFPIAIENEDAPPLGQRLDAALDLIEANAENGAPTTVLIHPNTLEQWDAQAALLKRLPPDIAVADMTGFARFWRARDRAVWDIKPAGPDQIELTVSSAESVSGLTFEFGCAVEAVEGATCRKVDARRWVLPPLAAGQPVRFRVRYTR